MGLLFVEVLPRDDEGGPGSRAAVLKCRRCRVDAASSSAILSRDFHGRLGRAYLFDRVEKAYEESEKYKEGKFILEKAMMCKEAQ